MDHLGLLGLIQPPVLVVGAHPDDIEYGVGGTLIKIADAGIAISAVVLSEGEPVGAPSRAIEGTAALHACGVSDVTILPYVNDDIVPCQRMVRELVRRGVNPRTVITLTRWDTHQDHRAVEMITMSAFCRDKVNVLGYATVSTTDEFDATIVSDVSGVFERKCAALKLHKSQQYKSYFQDDIVRNFHIHRPAAMLGMHCVELLHVFKAVWT